MRYLLNNFITDINIINTLSDCSSANKVVIIDKNIHKLFKKDLNTILGNSPTYLFEAKEANKTFTKIKEIYYFLIDNKVTRETIIIGIGGGITTDIAAFAASTFKRGCRLQLIPTTFLGMIDASIGGKTAINFNGVKNNIGSFYPAEKININTEFLKTLPEKELKNGWAECLKVSLILNNGLFEILRKGKQNITSEIIEKAIQIKMKLCETDLHDSGERQKLNLGHTFAHIIESASDYNISHGEAVAIGIRKAAEYSYNENLISKVEFNTTSELLNQYELLGTISDEIKNKIRMNGMELIQQDKKAGKRVRLVLFKGIHNIVVREIDDYKKVIDLITL